MEISDARKQSAENLKKLYRSYLRSKGYVESTVSTTVGDSFYLWNHVDAETFWRVIQSDKIDDDAKLELSKALQDNSSGNIDALIGGYVNQLKKLKAFLLSVEADIDDEDPEKAIKEFLLDIDCLAPLYEWTSRVNLFDILKISKTEIRHSNMLAWLLDPNENHGLGDSIIRGFIQFYVTAFSNNNDADIFKTLLMDCNDFIIQREWRNIDIIAIAYESKTILCIENKIDTGEHDNQLERYKKIVESSYPDFKVMYLYLSPGGNESSDPDNWCAMGYADVLDIIEKSRKRTQLLPDVELLVDNYVNTIRRDVLEDEKLAQICAEIYSKHKKALDLIFENRPDEASAITAIILDWANQKTSNGEMEVIKEKCVKSYTRFKTPTMSRLLPDSDTELSGWKTHNFYFYEITNNGKDVCIQLAFSAQNLPDDLRAMMDRINVYYKSRVQRDNWQWRIPFKTSKHIKINENFDENKFRAELDKSFEEIISFEKKLVGLLDAEN